MRRVIAGMVASACLVLPCYGGNSFVLPDGLSRSPAVTLHCTLDGTTAVPCGVPTQPLVVAPIEATPFGGQPVSRSIVLAVQQSAVLFAANSARHYLSFQAPAGVGIWVNLLGGIAGPNLIDCAYFAPGTFYESGAFVNRGSITVYAPVAVTVAAWEG